MRNFILTSAIVALSLGTLAPAQAATYRSAAYFDEQRALLNSSHKTITEAVLDKSIVPEVVRVQTETSHGVKALPMAKFEANMSALAKHCQVVRFSTGKDASGCIYKVDVKEFPTNSSPF